jgi:prepilin-type N-terminal cleavage/methylation domain-containing protein
MTRLKKLMGDAAADGFTIIELMVSIILLAVVSASFLAATNAIYSGVHKQQGVTDASDGNRKVLELLDKQVRYASAINAPATAADGNFYVDYLWTKTVPGQVDVPTCSQWRLNPVSDILQWRSWTSGTIPSPTPAWITIDKGVVNVPATQPPFALQAPVAIQTGIVLKYQELALNLTTVRDKGNVSTTSNFTALNSPSSGLPSTAVCQEVARS